MVSIYSTSTPSSLYNAMLHEMQENQPNEGPQREQQIFNQQDDDYQMFELQISYQNRIDYIELDYLQDIFRWRPF